MDDRTCLIEAFLAEAGWGGARRAVLAADASFRRYDRIALAHRRAVLMDAPPDREDVRPFVKMARHLRGMGYSAPDVLAENPEHGLVLLEDLGDDTYTRLLAGGADEASLYTLAVDVLIDLHARPTSATVPAMLPRYDDDRFLAEAGILIDYFLPAARGRAVTSSEAAAYAALWRAVLPLARAMPETLVLRDYHVDNLMRIPNRTGIAACGLLDFQDAVAGPRTYDFISLVEDARRDVAPAVADSVRARYLDAFPRLDRQAFETSCAILAAQRHCKVIGIFTRLCVRDGKPRYLMHIPRVWRLLEHSLAHPALASLKSWFDDAVPAGLRTIPRCLATQASR